MHKNNVRSSIIYDRIPMLLLFFIFCFSTPIAAEIDQPSNDVYESTVANSGEIAYGDDVTYKVEDGALYLENDTTGTTLLRSSHVLSVAYCQNSLYFAEYEDGVTSFFRNEESEPFFTTKGKVSQFSIANGELFYLHDQGVYCQNGTLFFEKEGLTFFSMQSDGTCLYTANGTIYRLSDGTSQMIAAAGEDESNDATTSATLYEPRLTAPTSDNQYYFSNLNIFYASGYGMPNCTAYAYGRAYEILGTRPNLCPNNAGRWYDYNVNNGYYPYGQTPKLGAIAVWANDSSHNQGHVAVVERINSDGTITISESYYGSTFFQTQTRSLSSLYPSKIFLGFIYILEDGYTEDQIATPTLSTSDVLGGKSVTLSCGTSGATIYYTTDGSTPTTSSIRYTGAFTARSPVTIRAIGVKSSMSNSDVMVQSVSMSQAATPSSSYNSGSLLAAGDSVSLFSSTSNASVYYTTDGSTPTTSSTKYTGAIILNNDCTIKAISAGIGMQSSDVATFTYSVWDNPFHDIESSDWFFSYVASAHKNNLINGTSEVSFSPDIETDRATFVTILSRLDVFDVDNYELLFSDVKEDQWYSGSIAWAAENGIVNGMGNNSFSPFSNISREQVCVILIRYANWCGIELATDGEVTNFTDGEKISNYARNSVDLAQRAGLINGRDNGTFDPQGSATRAEVTSIFMRFFERYQQ
ncbi:MAG TPA: chitobiase/beta-hexosaminidase C-terminal domain-containing protein [Firmicutes bacterium]|nr:chitobiase/beta-hexosaminidase C-terminal domain-containing protein [Bacillota bacterium]